MKLKKDNKNNSWRRTSKLQNAFGNVHISNEQIRKHIAYLKMKNMIRDLHKMNLKYYLDNIDIYNNSNFREILQLLPILQIPDSEICHHLDMSRPALARWISGRSVPHPLMRIQVLEFFKNKLSD